MSTPNDGLKILSWQFYRKTAEGKKPKENFYSCFDLLRDHPFFRIIKNRRPHQNTTNLIICQKQNDNSKWLLLSTYITDMHSNKTEKKANSIYITHEI